jgi:hypothetical protein
MCSFGRLFCRTGFKDADLVSRGLDQAADFRAIPSRFEKDKKSRLEMSTGRKNAIENLHFALPVRF